MGLSYDTSASIFFAITICILYLIPASIIIIARVRDFNAKQKKDKPVSFPSHLFHLNSCTNNVLFLFLKQVHARTKSEEDKFLQLSDAAAAADKILWTRNFSIFVSFTGLILLALLVFVLIAINTVELASYDPYQVSEIVQN